MENCFLTSLIFKFFFLKVESALLWRARERGVQRAPEAEWNGPNASLRGRFLYDFIYSPRSQRASANHRRIKLTHSVNLLSQNIFSKQTSS